MLSFCIFVLPGEQSSPKEGNEHLTNDYIILPKHHHIWKPLWAVSDTAKWRDSCIYVYVWTYGFSGLIKHITVGYDKPFPYKAMPEQC